MDQYQFKFITIGNTGVGKTSIIEQFTRNIFTPNIDQTIGVNFRKQTMNIGTTELQLRIWDTAGQEAYKSLTLSYIRGSHVVIAVYDITNIDTFRDLPQWIKSIEENLTEQVIIAIVGNKSDLEEERKVQTSEGEQFAATGKYIFFETSAKTGKNVQDLFEQLAQEAYNVALKLKQGTDINDPTPAPLNPTKKSRCC